MTETPYCRHCRQPMEPGGRAIVCAPGGRSNTIALAPHCTDPDCRDEREQQAIADAIAIGLIDA